MFSELIKLRELGRLLRKKQFEAVLDLARDPAIADHRKARNAADRARAALMKRAEGHRGERRFSQALRDVRLILRDDEDASARGLEKTILTDIDEQERRAASLAKEKERARIEVEEGEVTRALDRLQPLVEEDPGAASFLRDLEARKDAEAERGKRFEKALAAGRLQEAFALARDLKLKSGAGGAEDPLTQLLAKASSAADAPLMVGVLAEARRRHGASWQPPEKLREGVARGLIARAEKDLAAGAAGDGGDLLGVFPLGTPSDERAETLARLLRRLNRARRLFEEGQLEMAAAQAREALEISGRCAAARELLQQVERLESRSRKPLEKVRALIASGQLLKARAELVTMLEDDPNLGPARDLLQVVEEREAGDVAALQEAREKMAAGELDLARGLLLNLDVRRPDLEEVAVLLRDVDRRSKEARLRGFAEESLRIAAPRAAGGGAYTRAVPGHGEPEPPRTLARGKPFTLRVEERGDWLVHPGDAMVIGNSMAGAADLPVLAAIGSRHARLRRERGPAGGVSYHLEPGAGKRVARNRRVIESDVELHHGDVISLGDVLSFTFLRPVAGNESAVLRLEGSFLIHGCNKIILFAESAEGRRPGDRSRSRGTRAAGARSRPRRADPRAGGRQGPAAGPLPLRRQPRGRRPAPAGGRGPGLSRAHGGRGFLRGPRLSAPATRPEPPCVGIHPCAGPPVGTGTGRTPTHRGEYGLEDARAGGVRRLPRIPGKYPVHPAIEGASRNSSPMKTILSCITLLSLAGAGYGQEMEPNLRRAAGRLAARLAQMLPGIEPSPEMLVLEPVHRLDSRILGAVAGALSDDGYRIHLGRDWAGDADALRIVVGGTRERRGGVIELSLGDTAGTRLRCAFANADWLDDATPGLIRVESTFKSDRAAAVDAAFASAWHRLRARHGFRTSDARGLDLLRDAPRRLVVTWAAAPGGEKVYRAHLHLKPERRMLRRLVRESRRAERRRAVAPWMKFGGIAALALILGLGYAATDLRTRGYLTGTLRLAFGILFVIGAAVCWRVIA